MLQKDVAMGDLALYRHSLFIHINIYVPFVQVHSSCVEIEAGKKWRAV